MEYLTKINEISGVSMQKLESAEYLISKRWPLFPQHSLCVFLILAKRQPGP